MEQLLTRASAWCIAGHVDTTIVGCWLIDVQLAGIDLGEMFTPQIAGSCSQLRCAPIDLGDYVHTSDRLDYVPS